MGEKKGKMWLPLESNPAVFTDFAEKLGYPTIMFSFHDVYSIEPETWLLTTPQPVIAVVLLYQIKSDQKDVIKKLIEEQKNSLTVNPEKLSDLIFVKQTIGNACGTIALLHACCNTVDLVGGVREDSFIESFMQIP